MAISYLALVALSAFPVPSARAQEDLLGEIRTIASVSFEGRHRLGEHELLSVMKTRSPSFWPWRERSLLHNQFQRRRCSP